jgi:cytochrome b
LWLRNLSFWPQDIFIDVPLLQNRKGEPLDNSLVSVSQKPVRVEKYAAVTVALRIPPDKSHTISDATPVSGLVRIVSKSSNPDCKPAPQCQEPPGLSNLYIPIAISAPGSMRAGYLVAGACVAAGLVVLCIGSSLCGSLLHRMGSPTWNLEQSWASSMTIGAGLLSTLVTLIAFPACWHWMDKSSYLRLQGLFTAIIALAPLIYGLVHENVQAKKDGQAADDPQGYVVMFLIAGALVMWGALGQLATLGAMIAEFLWSATLDPLTGALLELLVLALLIVLLIGGSMTMYRTANQFKSLPEKAPGTHLERRLSAGFTLDSATAGDLKTPLAQWPLL